MGAVRRFQERHLTIEELARVRVPGVKFSRSVKRQFEQIADAVFDRREPFLEHEFRGLSTPEAVIDAVCDTFAAAECGRCGRRWVWTRPKAASRRQREPSGSQRASCPTIRWCCYAPV
ncbi:hypothetical protein [Streptomyces sp. NPDC002779]|uniref:NACHT N-terminal Helical domain 1-containing protein n=1 Tax=Streptomyces sp. NPDC002779 TaxID=3364664 RepID=UPI0036C9844D